MKSQCRCPVDYYFRLTTLSRYLNFQASMYMYDYLIEINFSRIIITPHFIKNYTDFHSIVGIGSTFNLKLK